MSITAIYSISMEQKGLVKGIVIGLVYLISEKYFSKKKKIKKKKPTGLVKIKIVFLLPRLFVGNASFWTMLSSHSYLAAHISSQREKIHKAKAFCVCVGWDGCVIPYYEHKILFHSKYIFSLNVWAASDCWWMHFIICLKMNWHFEDVWNACIKAIKGATCTKQKSTFLRIPCFSTESSWWLQTPDILSLEHNTNKSSKVLTLWTCILWII